MASNFIYLVIFASITTLSCCYDTNYATSNANREKWLEATRRYVQLTEESAYMVHEDWVSWWDASAACDSEGATLVVVNSDDEAATLAKLMTGLSTSVRYYHAGFHDLFQEGHYYTVFGQTFSQAGFGKWADTEPNNNGGNEDCGGIFYENGLMADMGCDESKYPYICEKAV